VFADGRSIAAGNTDEPSVAHGAAGRAGSEIKVVRRGPVNAVVRREKPNEPKTHRPDALRNSCRCWDHRHTAGLTDPSSSKRAVIGAPSNVSEQSETGCNGDSE